MAHQCGLKQGESIFGHTERGAPERVFKKHVPWLVRLEVGRASGNGGMGGASRRD